MVFEIRARVDRRRMVVEQWTESLWQVLRRRQRAAIDEDWDHRNAAALSGLDLEPHKISRFLEPFAQPSRADDNQNDVTGFDSINDEGTENEPELGSVDIQIDGLLTKNIAQMVNDTAGRRPRIVASVADKDSQCALHPTALPRLPATVETTAARPVRNKQFESRLPDRIIPTWPCCPSSR